jgi:hypothetical protein
MFEEDVWNHPGLQNPVPNGKCRSMIPTPDVMQMDDAAELGALKQLMCRNYSFSHKGNTAS